MATNGMRMPSWLKFGQFAGYGPVGLAVIAGHSCSASFTLVSVVLMGLLGTRRAPSGLLARGRIGQIFALTGVDAIRIACMILRGLWRCGVIVKAAVLIVGQEDDGIFPVRTVANCVDYLRHEGLASLNIRWRMLVIFGRGSRQPEIWIHKRNRRQ